MSNEGAQEVDDVVMSSLTKVFEDDDVVVYTAPNEEELKNILLNLLRKNGRMTVKDLHKYLSGLASEDKIRYALNDLLRKDIVTMDRQGFFYLTEPIDTEEAEGEWESDGAIDEGSDGVEESPEY